MILDTFHNSLKKICLKYTWLSETRLLPSIFTLAWTYYQITCGDGNDDLKSIYVVMRRVTLKRISIKDPENLKKVSSKTWKKLNTFQFI